MFQKVWSTDMKVQNIENSGDQDWTQYGHCQKKTTALIPKTVGAHLSRAKYEGDCGPGDPDLDRL